MKHCIRLPDETYEFIKGEVAFILKKCNIRCIPVSGFEIATKLKMKLRPYSALDTIQKAAAMKISSDGFFIESDEGEYIIFYNDDKSYARINMTLLHEIGHCVLDHGVSAFGNTDIEEAEAKFFAKYIAAPPPLIDKINPTSVDDVADWFCLSWEASYIAFNYFKKWKSVRRHHGAKDYEIIIENLFVSNNNIRKRLTSYHESLQT